MVHVLVIGSISMDLVVETMQFPRLGHTFLGSAFSRHPGGKGANQAVAATRLGARVTLLGCIGDDPFGDELQTHLVAEGIDLKWLKKTPKTASGIALITVYQGDNAILVVPGANMQLQKEDLVLAEAAFQKADVVIAQLETPLDTVDHAALLAQKYHKPFMLNPAPAQILPNDLLKRVTVLTPNEHELPIVFNQENWQAALLNAPCPVVMTHGSDGIYFRDPKTKALAHQNAFHVDVMDSTGAGDTFNAALAVFWQRGEETAYRYACAAGALATTKMGAQEGMPTLVELETFLKHPS